MAMVGSSMMMGGSGAGFSTSVMVSPMVMPSTPAMATMSPISVSVDVGALEALEAEELGDLGLLQRAVALGDDDSSPILSVPLKTRAMPRRPR